MTFVAGFLTLVWIILALAVALIADQNKPRDIFIPFTLGWLATLAFAWWMLP